MRDRIRSVAAVFVWSCAAVVGGAAGCGADGGGAALPIVWEPPRNPHLADSGWAIFHKDSYAQHFSTLPGPTGATAGGVLLESVALDGIPVFVLFDPDENILTVSKRISGVTLWKIDRATLTPLGSIDVPVAGGVFAGMYGFIDAAGRAVLGIGKGIYRYQSDATGLALDTMVDLSAAMAADDNLVSISVLYTGEIAFLTAQGTLGVLPASLETGGGTPVTLAFTGEQVSNGFSLDETGAIFVVTDLGLRRLEWDGAALTLTERWFEAVEHPFTSPRPGRLGTGSGTTPALMMTDHVVIADDAEQMNLMVVARGADTTDGQRVTCKLPVFDEAGATDNAIVIAGRTMIIEQNLEGSRGVARFDLAEDGTCARAWVADVNAPTCVPTLSTASNLVYVYTNEDDDWGLTGLDVRDGHTAFRASAGVGGVYNNYYSAVTVGPEGRVYVGTISGLLVFSDAP